MPLKVITLIDQWLEILMFPDRHGLTVAETCHRYQISRQMFYEYWRRYRADGQVTARLAATAALRLNAGARSRAITAPIA